MSPETLLAATFGPMLAGAVLCLVLDMVRRPGAAALTAAGGLALGGGLALWGGWGAEARPALEAFLTGAVFSSVPGVIALLAAVAILGGMREDAEGSAGTRAALMAFCAIGAGLSSAAIELTALVLSLETAALAGYALVAAGRGSRPAEASMKYYVQAAVATGLIVFGVSVLIGLFAPSGLYLDLAGALGSLGDATSTPALAGTLFLIAGLVFKAGGAPFHSWAPDAYETAPAGPAAVMAGAVKLGMIAAIALAVATIAPQGASGDAPLGRIGGDLIPIVGALGALSVIVGSLGALGQRSYARMLGYAGVAQVGYALIAISALNPSAAAVFGVTYAIGATGAFLACDAYRAFDHDWDGSVAGLAGMGRRSAGLGVAVTAIMASLAGLPPLLGFWGKFQAFGAALAVAVQFSSQGRPLVGAMYGTFVAIAIGGSIVSLGYYGSVVRSLFLDTPAPAHDGDPDEPAPTGDRSALRAVVFVAVLVVVLGFVPLVIGIPDAVGGFLLG